MKKVLILYEKMGMGHKRMANILEDMLQTEGKIVIEKYAGSELLGESDVNFIIKLWNKLIKFDLIKTCDVLVNFVIRICGLPFIEVFDTTRFMNKLDEINPDMIICTADGFNRVLGTYCREREIPFFIVITEVSVFIDLVNPYATHIIYFNETGEAIRNYDFNTTYFSYKLDRSTGFFKKSLYVLKFYNEYVFHCYKNSIYRNPDRLLKKNNKVKYRVIGPLAERKHFKAKNQTDMRIKNNIPEEIDTVLIASGSIGGIFLLDTVKKICEEFHKPLNLLVMCGSDMSSFKKNSVYKNKNSMINIMPYKYINNFDELITASDCIIARPSAGIFIESLINGTPEITFKRATSNDKGALTMLEKYHMGEVCVRSSDIVPKLNKILENREEYKKNIEELVGRHFKDYDIKKKLIRKIILEEKFEIKDEAAHDITEDDRMTAQV
jgi:UDP-N-acetylglucosamine:LPS N-acetylglucosamine transferase